MKAILKIIAVLMLSTILSEAQHFRVGYVTYISKKDLMSSGGKKLTSAAAILQQDRANYHKFKKRDKGDTDDGGFFAELKNRSNFPTLLKRGKVHKSMLNLIRKGDVHILVELFTDEQGNEYLDVSLVE